MSGPGVCVCLSLIVKATDANPVTLDSSTFTSVLGQRGDARSQGTPTSVSNNELLLLGDI